jgi:hypothetical protein
MRADMPHRLACCAVVLVVSLMVAGCGSGQSSKSETAPVATPSPSASAPSSARPTSPPGLDATAPPRPTQQADTIASALDYGRYFAQVVQYAIEIRDSSVITGETDDLSGCTNCVAVASLVSQLKRTRYWQLSDPIVLGRFRAVPMQGGVRVRGTFVYPEVKSVRITGKVARTDPPDHYRYYVDLKWAEARKTWRVLDFIYGKKR